MKKEEIKCSDCEGVAKVAWVHPSSEDIATPYCEHCSNENEEVERSIYDHEMHHFGGAYGVPSHKEYPVEKFDWYLRNDGRFEAKVPTHIEN